MIARTWEGCNPPILWRPEDNLFVFGRLRPFRGRLHGDFTLVRHSRNFGDKAGRANLFANLQVTVADCAARSSFVVFPSNICNGVADRALAAASLITLPRVKGHFRRFRNPGISVKSLCEPASTANRFAVLSRVGVWAIHTDVFEGSAFLIRHGNGFRFCR